MVNISSGHVSISDCKEVKLTSFSQNDSGVLPFDIPKITNSKVNTFRPTVASIIVTMGSFIIGMALGYPSTAVPNLNNGKGPFKLDSFQQSWFVSVVFLSSTPGALLSGMIMDKYGRKTTILFCSLPHVIGWILIACAHNVWMMYGGRIITGFFIGVSLSITGVYISEIAPPHLRGALISFHGLAANIGILLVYILGTFIRWNWVAISCAGILTVMACALLFMPETPRWLVMNNERDRAYATLQWIRGIEPSEELKEIEESVKDTKEMTPWLHFLKPPVLKFLLITQFLFLIQNFSGINILRQYTVSIFEIANTSLNPNVETIIVGLMLVAGSVLFTLVVERRERRVFLLISCMMMVLGQGAIGAYIVIEEYYANFARSVLFWLPLLAMVTTCFGFVIGVGPLPYIISSEVFNNRARGRASSIGITVLSLAGFLTTKYYVELNHAIGNAGSFFFCASICFIGFIIAWCTVPETKGKKLELI